MLLVSKILTLNKIHILKRLCSSEHGPDDPPFDYFQLGEPLTNPPRVRGTMVLKLKPSFIHDNAEFFECGSPVDVGALQCGFLRPPHVESFLANVKCDHRKFRALLDDLNALPGDALAQVAGHRKAPAAVPVLARHFDRAVVEFMNATDEPAAWMFELALRKGYRLAPEHVEEIVFPNTYADVPLFRRLRALFGSRAREFNPRLGLENVCGSAALAHERESARGGEGYRVVGMFEDFKEDVFPTHVLPIVAHCGNAGYTRWNYRIEMPHRFKLLEPVGSLQSAPEKLFPVFTYRLCEPKQFSERCQVIALSPDEVVVETSRIGIATRLLMAMVRHLHDRGYVRRAWTTMRNSLHAT